MLLAADVLIGLLDNTASYSRVVSGNVATYTPLMSPAEISISNFTSDFVQNFNVVVNTQNVGFSDPGDITLSDTLINSVPGIHSLTLQADRDISVEASVISSGVGVGTTLILNADRDANGEGRVAIIGVSNSIEAGAGNIVIGGGLDPLLTPAIGRDGAPQGVFIEAAFQTTDAGTISIFGQGGGASDDNASGVVLVGLISSLDGAISIEGIAGTTTGIDSDGVKVDTAASITTNRGAINIIGTSGGSTSDNDGVFVGPSAVVSSTAIDGVIGAVTINGASDSTTGAASRGVYVTGSTISVGNAALSIIGRTTTTGAGASNIGVLVDGAQIGSSGTALTGVVGGISIDGRSDSLGLSTHGVLVTDPNGGIQSADAAIQITGDARGLSGNGQGEGVTIGNGARVLSVEVNVAGPISINGTGAGSSGEGVLIFDTSSVGGARTPVTVTGTSDGSHGVVIESLVQGDAITINGTGIATNGGAGVIVATNGSVQSNSNLQVLGSSNAGTSFGIDLFEGIVNAAGLAAFTSTGELRLVRAEVNAGLAVTIDTIDRAGENDVIDVFESNINASTGDVFLTSGDSIIIDSTSSIAGNNLVINVDNVADADIGFGGNVDPQGTYTLSGNATVFGGGDADVFRPIAGIVSSIDGGGQPSGQTDAVLVDGGAEGVSVTPLSVSTSNESALLTNIEFAGIITTGSVDITGSPLADSFTLSRSGSNTFVDRPGAARIVFDPASVAALTIDGVGGNDTLEIDLTGGLPAGSITFQGDLPNAAPGDQLLITGTPPVSIDTLAFSPDAAGRGSLSIGPGTSIAYTGVESIVSSIDVQNTFFSLVNDTVIDVSQTAGDLTAAFSAGTTTTFRQPATQLRFDGLNSPSPQVTMNFAAIDVAIPTIGLLFGGNPPNSTVNINGPLRNSIGGLAVSQANININAAIDIAGSFSIDDSLGNGLTTINAPSISTGGPQTYFSPIQISTDATITSPNSLIFQSTVDGANRLTIDGDASFRGSVGSTTPLGSLNVIGNAGIGRSITTSGNQIYDGAVTIDQPDVVITSQLGSLTFNSNLDSGGGGFFNPTTNSRLTSSFAGPVGELRPFTSLTTIAGGPFVVPTSVSVSSYSVTVADTAGAIDTITVPTGATVNVPGGVTLTAGDDVMIQIGASIITSLLSLNADTDPVNPDTFGANVSVLGTINANSGTSISTGDDADTLAVRPQSTTSFDLRGGGPSVAPGDTLTIDGGGGDVIFDVASGAITVPGAQPILAVGLENLTLTNIGTLSVDGSNAFDLITVAGGAVLGSDLLSINGNSPIALVGVTNLVINGLGGDDFFGYDVRTRAISAAVTFNGGLQDNTTGGDTLRIDGSFTSQVLNYTAPGAEGNNGDLVLDGTTVTYTGLEPIVAGNSVDTILNFNTGVANNATLRNNPSAGLIEIVDNGATFEDTQFPNPSRGLAINLGSQGDTLSVVALDPAFRAGLAIRGGIGADTVTIDGLTISNTTGGTGALQIEDIEALDIANSIFNNNNATAIQLDNPGGVATIATTTIIGNTSSSSGGGIFLNQGDLRISNSTISSNVATVAGGGISIGGLGGAVEISDTTIEDNSADDVGGGIARIGSTASTILTNVMLGGNVATANAGRGHGGGLYFDGLTNTQVLGGRIFNNIANAEGGGIWQDFGVLTVSGSARIDGNFANGDLDPAGAPNTLQGGGGIFNDGGTVVINDVGGAVEISSNFATGTTFGSGGGILSTGGSVTITGARISNNATVRAGGGLEIVEGNVTLINCTIDANRVATQSPITANPGNGGGLHITGGATVTIDGGSVTNNIAEEEGGGLWNSATGTLRVIGLTSPVSITGNIARGDAAPGVDGSAVQGGGGIFNNGGTLVLDRGNNSITISGNAATGGNFGSGGGILSINGPVDIAGVEINGNEAVRSGGGVEIVDGTVTLSGGQITGNDVSAADLLGLDLGSSLGNGGGLHVTGTANVNITSVGITSNVAGREGGGLWNNSGTMTIQLGTVIDSNIASGDAVDDGGGGIFNNGGSLLITGAATTILNNQANGANGAGGGIFNLNTGTVSISGATITGNTAALDGGGLFANGGGTILIDQTSFSMNRALAGAGGGISVINTGASGNATITRTTINNNSATTFGGGIAFQNFDFLIENATISNNSGGDAGGGIAYQNVATSGQRSLRFSTITDNTATTGSNLTASGNVIDVQASIFNNGTIDAPGFLNSIGNNLDSGNTGGFAGPGDLINTDPLLGPLQDNGGLVLTHALFGGSPAIDAAGSAGPATDARGIARPIDGTGDGVATFDSGAFEGEQGFALVVDDIVVNENVGSIFVTVRLPNAFGSSFTVDFATSDGTATSPSDYIASTGTLTFAGTAGETQTITIPIIDDLIVESSESFNVALSNASVSGVDISSIGVVTITDNDVVLPTVNVAVSPSSVAEDGATNLVYTFTRTGGTTSPLTINYATSGTATAGTDFTGTNLSVLIPAGAASVTVVVDPTADTTVESDETVVLTIVSNAAVYTVGTASTASGIIENDDTETATLSINDVTVNENAGTATITVSVDNAVQDGFTVDFATSDLTAVAPADYLTASGTLTFAGTTGETQQFTIAIVDDAIFENTESLNVLLSNPSISAVDATATATITILDNDVAPTADLGVTISDALSTVEVNGTVVYTVVVNNLGPDAATSVFSTTTVPAGVTITNVSATGASVSTNAGVVTANVDSLVSGASITVLITVDVGVTPGSVLVSSSVTSTNDPNATNNSATTTTIVEARPATDLSLTSDSNLPIFSGATGSLDFLVSNLSTIDATSVVALFTLDPNLRFDSGSVFQGTVTSLPLTNQVRVELPSLAANVSAFVTLSVTARNNLASGLTLTTSGTVSANETDSDPSNNLVSVANSVLGARTLTTGTQDGGVVLTVDALGSMGRRAIGGLSQFNPLGPIDAAETIFEAVVLLGQAPNGTRKALTSGALDGGGQIPPDEVTLISDLAGTDTRVTSSFLVGTLRFDLVQELFLTLDATGTTIGSTLSQTYTITNTATTSTAFDLVRFLDADLEFDGEINDGGGIRRTANGDVLLFVTESSTLPGADTTFVGIEAIGGTTLASDRFQVAEFFPLESQVIAGAPLNGTVTGDLDEDELIDAGQEYDVSLALRNLFQLAAGASTTYETNTFFGSGPISPRSSITGHVFCDANGSGAEEAGEAEGNVTVFVDLNGNRVLDANELSTLTNASGDFFFSNVAAGSVTVAVVVPDGCNTIPRNVGVARTSLDAGRLARSIATVDLDGDLDMDLVIASDLSNSVTIFQNNGGVFSIQETVTLSDRPQAISAWSPGSGSSESVLAVAGFGTPSNNGNVFKIADGITESFKAGDGPIALVVDDFNGDSIADIVSVASRSSDLSLTLGREPTSANPSSIEAPQNLTGVRNIRAIITGDFNGDGNTDIAAAGLGFGADANSELKVLLGRGNGTFETAISRAGDREIIDLVATDLDGDGNDELLTLSATGQLKTYRLSGLTLSQMAQTSVSIGASSFAVGDFNGDGMTDVAVANLGNELIELLVGDRTGRFFLKSTVTNVTAPSDIVVADFDGDGKAEIAVANFYQQLPEVVTDQTPRNRLPSTLTILKLNIAEQAVMVTSESTSTVNVTFPSANPAIIFDVNRDSVVSAVDALEVISVMRQNDLALLSNAESEQTATHKTGKVVFRAPQRVAADVNGDGRTSALDALMVINYLNQQQLEQLLAVTGESSASQSLAYGSPRVNNEDEDKKHVAAIDALFAGGLF